VKGSGAGAHRRSGIRILKILSDLQVLAEFLQPVQKYLAKWALSIMWIFLFMTFRDRTFLIALG
jgi:hypothetical protein